MNPHDNDPLHAAINAKLAAIVEASWASDWALAQLPQHTTFQAKGSP